MSIKQDRKRSNFRKRSGDNKSVMEKQGKDMKEKMRSWILTLELACVLTEEEKQKALERLEEIYPSSENPIKPLFHGGENCTRLRVETFVFIGQSFRDPGWLLFYAVGQIWGRIFQN